MISTTSQSFPNTRRLRKAREFKTALDEGTKVVSPVIVTVARKAAEENSRLGLIVSKKVGNSVTRNRVKRYIRESFRKLPEEKSLSGYDIVVIGRALAAQTNQVTVNQHLEQCLQRLAKKLENR